MYIKQRFDESLVLMKYFKKNILYIMLHVILMCFGNIICNEESTKH